MDVKEFHEKYFTKPMYVQYVFDEKHDFKLAEIVIQVGNVPEENPEEVITVKMDVPDKIYIKNSSGKETVLESKEIYEDILEVFEAK